MRVLLVVPRARLTGYGRLFSAAGEVGLGILYVAAAAEARGHQVRVALCDESAVVPVLKSFVPEVVGLSSVTATYPTALAIARTVKSFDPTIPVVMGGHHVTFTTGETLQEACVDYVVRGEGEEAFTELLDHLGRGDRLPAIRGVALRRDGRVDNERSLAEVTDLDSLPLPDQSLLGNPGRVLIIGSRGCPHHCTFCSVPGFYRKKWRKRSVDGILAELETIARKRELRRVEFRDDNLLVDPRWVEELCTGIRRRGWRFEWHCLGRTDTVARQSPLLDLMKASGCAIMGLGLESCVQEIVDGYKKGTSVEQALEVSARLREKGILQIWFAMIGSGDHFDTPQAVGRHVELLAGFPFDLLQVSLLTPFPGTVLYGELEGGQRLLHRNWELYDGMHCVYRPGGMSASALEAELARAYRRIFLGSGVKRIVHTLYSARKFVFNTVQPFKLLRLFFEAVFLRKDVV